MRPGLAVGVGLKGVLVTETMLQQLDAALDAA